MCEIGAVLGTRATNRPLSLRFVGSDCLKPAGEREARTEPEVWLDAASTAEVEILGAECVRSEVAETSPVGADADEHDLRILGALSTIGILLHVGAQTAVALGAGKNVRASLALERNLVFPADDDRNAGECLQIAELARADRGVEQQLAAIGRRDPNERRLWGSVRPARRDHRESTIADELDQVRAVQRAPPVQSRP